ncbi:MAG: endonuclease III [Prevotellaceae bacterium]|jgi:endonuclease-3|nr:endonuclease III [Prevotellaceae bacterium]
MLTTDRYRHVIAWFEANVPVAESELRYGSPYELLVAVMLSAQCTDKRVNMVTPALLAAFPTPQAMAQADERSLYALIKSISYPNSKAKHLKGMAELLVRDFGGLVPDDIDALQRLPGVGRKTANVVASVAYGKPAIAVDTHVFRVAKRVGLAPPAAKTPLEVERQLTKHIALALRPIAHHWLILHGRYVCLSRRPKCGECGLSAWCRFWAQEAARQEKNKVNPI